MTSTMPRGQRGITTTDWQTETKAGALTSCLSLRLHIFFFSLSLFCLGLLLICLIDWNLGSRSCVCISETVLDFKHLIILTQTVQLVLYMWMFTHHVQCISVPTTIFGGNFAGQLALFKPKYIFEMIKLTWLRYVQFLCKNKTQKIKYKTLF